MKLNPTVHVFASWTGQLWLVDMSRLATIPLPPSVQLEDAAAGQRLVLGAELEQQLKAEGWTK